MSVNAISPGGFYPQQPGPAAFPPAGFNPQAGFNPAQFNPTQPAMGGYPFGPGQNNPLMGVGPQQPAPFAPGQFGPAPFAPPGFEPSSFGPTPQAAFGNPVPPAPQLSNSGFAGPAAGFPPAGFALNNPGPQPFPPAAFPGGFQQPGPYPAPYAQGGGFPSPSFQPGQPGPTGWMG